MLLSLLLQLFYITDGSKAKLKPAKEIISEIQTIFVFSSVSFTYTLQQITLPQARIGEVETTSRTGKNQIVVSRWPSAESNLQRLQKF